MVESAPRLWSPRSRGYYIQTEGATYKEYRDGYVALTDDDPETVYVTSLSTSDVLAARDFHRTNLDKAC